MRVGSCRVRLASCAVLVACLLGVAVAAADDAPPLLRFPDIHGDTVVFVHGEDVWAAPVEGGLARRLTDDEGEERHPKFSPSGELIAFTGDMDGNADVYVMDADGGNVRRLTFHPSPDEVVGWHPTREMVLFRSNRGSFSRFDRLFLVAPDGGGVEELPLHEAGRASFSADGGRIVYNRIAREDRTWKRYHGGMAQDLWLYDFATAEDRQLTDYTGTDRLPMWIGDTVYFASDRDRVMNIYSYRIADGVIERITDHSDWDVRRPSAGSGRIVHELGGDLWVLDPGSRDSRRIPIRIPVQPRETRSYRRNVKDFITDLSVSPEGGRALVCARGDVFTVPAKHGTTRNLTRSAGVRDRNAAWSPDGTQVAYLSDGGGEYDIWIASATEDSPARRVTDLGPGFRHTLRWSPDGARIAFADHTLALFFVEVATGEVTLVDRAQVEPMDVGLEDKPISDFAWSPDSRWLAYSKIGLDQVSNIYLYSLSGGTAHNASNGLFNDFGPVFTADGRHLVFVSNRRFDPTFCDFEWEMVYKNMAGIYALTLREGDQPLLPLLSDESARAEDGDDDEPAGDVVVRVDADGLAERVQALPLPAGNYRELAVARDRLLYLNGDDGDFNRFEYRQLGPRDVESFSFSDREESTLVEGVDAYGLSADRSHVVYLKRGSVAIKKVGREGRKEWKVDREKGSQETTVDLDGVEMVIDPRAEWLQVYDEAWRMERDFYYDPNMRGLDWDALGDRYRALIIRASCAQDVRFVIGELIGELATSHTYIRTGDRRRAAARVDVGLLGADWEIDADTGRYRLAKIFRVPDWSRGVEPPLAGTGVDVAEGDYLLAVNGEQVLADQEVYASFQGMAGKQVRLLFNDRPQADGAREVVVTPVSSERFLRYLDWVEHNRRVVDEATAGRVGYIHLPDTYVGSAVEFPKYYYSQTMKEGLIVDGRFNGGGLDPDIFLARLAKRPLSYWTRRYSQDQVTPVYVSRAHMVCLTNRQAGSGGDELPFEFRAKGMGPVIGTRTWGGLVGVSMSVRLMDGSRLTAPDYRVYTPEGQWTVENEGVTPDIEIELEPADMMRGWDAQLQKGIEVLLEQLEAEALDPVTHPPIPGFE